MKDETLQKFAELVEKDVETIRAEIEGLMQREGLSEAGAFAVWKAQHSLALRSGKPQNVAVRILSRRLPEVRTLSTGETKVADIELIYQDEDGQVGWGYSTLWGERADIADQVEIGKAYMAKARFSYHPTKVKMTGFELLGPAPDNAVPTIADIAEVWEIGKLEEIENYAGSTELFRGMVGRVIKSNDGTDTVIGIEISNEDSLPITCWAGRGRDSPPVPEVAAVLGSLNVGDEVLVYAYVNAREDGTVSLNAGGVFAL